MASIEIDPLCITLQSLFSGPPDQSTWMFTEFNPGMAGKGVLVCCMASLRKWSIWIPWRNAHKPHLNTKAHSQGWRARIQQVNLKISARLHVWNHMHGEKRDHQRWSYLSTYQMQGFLRNSEFHGSGRSTGIYPIFEKDDTNMVRKTQLMDLLKGSHSSKAYVTVTSQNPWCVTNTTLPDREKEESNSTSFNFHQIIQTQTYICSHASFPFSSSNLL